MFFVGYIPSLIIAIGLFVFYVGNITQSVIASIKDKQSKEVCIVKNNAKPAQKCFVVSINKVSNNVAVAPKQEKPIIRVLFFNKLKYYSFDKKTPKEFCKASLFLRPPPAVIS